MAIEFKLSHFPEEYSEWIELLLPVLLSLCPWLLWIRPCVSFIYRSSVIIPSTFDLCEYDILISASRQIWIGISDAVSTNILIYHVNLRTVKTWLHTFLVWHPWILCTVLVLRVWGEAINVLRNFVQRVFFRVILGIPCLNCSLQLQQICFAKCYFFGLVDHERALTAYMKYPKKREHEKGHQEAVDDLYISRKKFHQVLWRNICDIPEVSVAIC